MSGTILVCLNLLSRTMRCFSKYVILPIQTLSPYEAGPSIAVGLYGGLFPVPGTTIPVTLLLIYITPKSFSTAMKGLAFAVNTISFPLELLLLPHFIHTGSLFFDDLDCDSEQLLMRFYDKDAHVLSIIRESSSCLGAGVLIWLALTPPVLLLLSALFTLLLGGKLTLRDTSLKDAKKISV